MREKRHFPSSHMRALQTASLALVWLCLAACEPRSEGPAPASDPASSPASPSASAPASAPLASPASAAASDAASTASAAASSVQAETALHVAFVYRGPVSDGGWTLAHDKARQSLEKTFGSRIRTTQIENVTSPADALRVMQGLAEQGNRLVFDASWRRDNTMGQMTSKFPSVVFESLGGPGPKASNLASYDSRSYQGAYMAGLLAGAMTKTNTLGVVAAQPTPENLLNINSFTLGAQRTNPAIVTRVVWVGEWFNPTREAEAAATLINGGADVLMPFTDSSAALKAAEEMDRRSFGWNADMSAHGAKAHIASAIVNWAPYYRQRVQEVMDGSWQPGAHWWGVKEDVIDLVALAPDVPEAARKALDDTRAGLKSGQFEVWRGPISNNQGSVVLEKSKTADDAFLRAMNFYVSGVEGEVPAMQ